MFCFQHLSDCFDHRGVAGLSSEDDGVENTIIRHNGIDGFFVRRVFLQANAQDVLYRVPDDGAGTPGIENLRGDRPVPFNEQSEHFLVLTT